ncbi:hypothetical protein DFH09DRAFT_1381555 [Mycena vulgaris]|nr:hypothetical protein DFH09DRAFT_1381555 [Mycena vulgaris]
MSTERDPLLHAQESEDSAPAAQKEPAPIHPYYIVVVAFLVNLCAFFTETTMVEILFELVCRLYWHFLGDGAHAPFPGDSDKCAHPSVRRYFTMLITLSGVMESAAGLFMYAPMSRLSGKYGRRIMLVGLTAMLILSSLCMIGAYRLPTPFTAPLLVLWLITMSIAGSSRFSLMTVMYVVDTTSPQQRTAQLSILIGWGYAAGIPGFSLGGALTTYTDSNTAVYWTVIAIALGLLAFIAFFGRPFYGERALLPANNSESTTELARQGTSSGNSKMDKHLAIFVWMIDIVAIALFPLARTRIQVLIPLVILGASYFRVSAFRSVVVASGDPLRSGEIMAAIQTVSTLGAVLSGLVLGSVISASINTFPGLVFLVCSAVASVSVLALCLIKESDRYIAPVQLSDTS